MQKNTSIPLLFIMAFLISSFTSIQSESPINGYYVVVAAYGPSHEILARRFAEKITSDGHEANYSFFQTKNMFLVYLEYFSDRSPSIQHMREVRKTTPFDDTWVYVYKNAPDPVADEGGQDEEVQEVESDQEVEAKTEDEIKTEETKEDEEIDEGEKTDEVEADPVILVPPVTDVRDTVSEEEEKGKYKLYFHLTHGRTREVMDGDIEIIDPSNGNVVEIVQANQLHYITPPNRNSEKIQFEAEVFGFRKMIHTIDFELTHIEELDFTVNTIGDTTVIFFDLMKFRKGDIFILFHVYFFNASAVMRPDSQNELFELREMLVVDPKLRIMLHGYVNGGGQVKGVKYHPDNDANFFSINEVKYKDVSAKELSEMRAKTLKNYLVYNGIDASRIEIKGWGGKNSLYEISDPRAYKNVRVEVEVIE